MKEKLKNKKVIAGIISGIAVITVVVIAVIIMSQGNTISTRASDYLDTEKMDSDVIDQTKVTIDMSNNDNSDNDFASIGEYKVTLKYEDETAEVKVNVKDTTKPTFDKFEENIEITKDCKPDGDDLNKLLKKFTAKDLQDVTISLDDTAVDYTKEGEYKATVKAVDASNNETDQETTIKIVKPTIKLDKKSESMYVKESFVLKATITGKDDKASFKSSNSSVASVDKNGKVTAKKKGTATITATANGVSTECKVTVNSVPSGSTTSKKTVTNPSGSSNSTLTASISMEAFNEINRQRANLGRSQLELASEWTEIAKKRAKEITVNFSHDALDKYFSPHTVGECCSFGHGGAIATVRNGWMQSQNHKAILMDPENTKLIVANYGDYWVALVK